MIRPSSVRRLASGGFLAYAAGIWILTDLLGLTGGDLWKLRTGLWLIGLVAALVVTWFFGRSTGRNTPQAALGDEIDTLVGAARKRLAAAGRTAGLGKLPMVLVMGPTGSAKSYSVIRSGLDPELLAGEVMRGDAVVSTADINLWYAQDTVLLEAGGALVEDPARWRRLARLIRPARLRAALLGRPLAPRSVVVCMPCGEFLKPGSSERVATVGRLLRERLLELADDLGTTVPVYVVFTKMDEIPHFADYVRNLSRAETAQVLGVTLPFDLRAGGGTYAERESARLKPPLERLFQSLAARRLDFLRRETTPEGKAAAYEFPREFHRFGNRVIDFLVELCKPSQLSLSPMLRGFYFSGVRAVVPTEPEQASPAARTARSATPAVGATQVFDPAAGVPAAQSAAPVPGAGSRRVPQWLFLTNLFHSVVLRDRTARTLTGGGSRINMLRRAGLATAVALTALYTLGLTGSFVANRRMRVQTVAAARALAPGLAQMPLAVALRRLDTLGTQVSRMGRHAREGAPLGLRWGLYSGRRLRPYAQATYYEHFRPLLLEPALGALSATLASPSAGSSQGDAFVATYDQLKSYLIVTTYPDSASPDFLMRTLTNAGQRAVPADDDARALAERQFGVFAEELAGGAPWTLPADPDVISNARTFLAGFTGFQPVYQHILARAETQTTPVRFNRDLPGSERVVRNSHEVPGAFTRDGLEFVAELLQDSDSLFAGEAWVLGTRAVRASGDDLVDSLRIQYIRDYIRQWQDFLAATRVVAFSGYRDGATKLGHLSGNESPLLQLLFTAAHHTDLPITPPDSGLPVSARPLGHRDEIARRIATVFQPVHAVVPDETAQRFIDESNQAYVQELLALQATLANVATVVAGQGSDVVSDVRARARQARLTVQQLSQNFNTGGVVSEIGRSVSTILGAPLDRTDAVVRGFEATDLNRLGRGLCASVAQLMRMKPFDPTGLPASIDDIATVFDRENGLLAQFHTNHLTGLLSRSGNRYLPVPGGTTRLTGEFVDFFNRAMNIRSALFPPDRDPMQFPFSLKLYPIGNLPMVSFSLGGQYQRYTQTSLPTQPFQWTAGQAMDARLSRSVRGVETPLLDHPGIWGLFDLFQQARWQGAGGSLYNVSWDLDIEGQGTVRLAAEVDMLGGPALLHPNFLTGLSCPARIAR